MPVTLLYLSFLLTFRKPAFLLFRYFWQDHLEEMMLTMKIDLMFFRPSLKGFFWLGLFVLHSSSLGIDHMSENTISEYVTTKVGDTAKLSCDYKISGSLKPYKIYWQKHEKNSKDIAVVLSYVNGQEDISSKDPRYLNRSKMDEQNLTLSIFSVKVSDSGLYRCVIIENFDVKKQCIVNLSVTADFSAPVIELFPSRCWQESLKLTCSSHGGYPQPIMTVFVNNELVLWSSISKRDNQTDLFNITSHSQINGTEWILVNCSVGYTGFQLYTILNVSRNCPVEQPPSHGVFIASAVLLSFVALIVLVILFRGCNCQHLRSSDHSCSPQPVATNEGISQTNGTSDAISGKQVL